MSLPKGPWHSREDGDNHCLPPHILNQLIGQETEAGGPARATPNLESLRSDLPSSVGSGRQRAEKWFGADREQLAQDYKVFRILFLDVMARVGWKKQLLLCEQKSDIAKLKNISRI